jgi:hypothetical protein
MSEALPLTKLGVESTPSTLTTSAPSAVVFSPLPLVIYASIASTTSTDLVHLELEEPCEWNPKP